MGNITSINLLTFIFTLIMSVTLMVLPRRLALIPLILIVCYIPVSQRIVLVSLDFTMVRIFIIFGWLRLILRKEIHLSKLNGIDKRLICWVIANVTIYTLLRLTFGDFINRLGFAYDAIGIYFLSRLIVINLDDFITLIKALAIAMVPLAISMLIEEVSGKNVFSIFGGVAETTVIRGGKLRCQGSFSHPILAGTFGVTSIPLFVGLWFRQRQRNFRVISIVGIIAGTIITMTSQSSGPIITYLCVIVGFLMWPLRNHMRIIRWGILFIVVSLHLIMKAPIWYLMARASEFVGGHGWYRSYLLEQAITHVEEWWLFGTQYTAHWISTNVLPDNPNMVDITNQYIREGVDGGLLTLILFIMIISICFRTLGVAMRRVEDNKPNFFQGTLWSIGVCLFAHVVSFFSVRYFDQMVIIWYLLVASISSTGNLCQTISEKRGECEG